MKIQNLKKRIIKNFSIAGVMAVVCASIFYFYSTEKDGVQTKISKINEETSQINIELTDLQSKTAEIKKYKDLWPTISENKKSTSGMKIDEINTKLDAVANKYGVSSQSIKLSLPEAMKGGVFDRKTVTVMMATATLNFVAVNDVKAMMFAQEFLGSLKGYPVITSFSLSKPKDYSGQDLVNVSTGKSGGLIDAKVSFFWYIYKESEKKEEAKTAPGSENKTEEQNAQNPSN